MGIFPSWRSRGFRGLVYQLVTVALLAGLVWFLGHNTLENMRERGIQSGFGIFTQPAGFAIGESLIGYDASDPIWKAFLVGLVNTLRVALIGIVFTTVLGLALGIGRLSRNFLLRGICTFYVEVFRNLPVLLQIFIWYFIVTDWFPDISAALQPMPGVFLSKNGMSFPVPGWVPAHLRPVAGLVLGGMLAFGYRRWAWKAFERTGQPRPILWPMLALIFGLDRKSVV